MHVRQSATAQRAKERREYKIFYQAEAVSTINKHMPKKKSKWEALYQTPGPGHVLRNYSLWHTLPVKQYHMVEYNRETARSMFREVQNLRQFLFYHPEQPRIHFKRSELFTHILTSAKPRSVRVVDACLCSTLKTLIKDGLLEDIIQLGISNKCKQDVWFLSLTSSRRTIDSPCFARLLKKLQAALGLFWDTELVYKKNYKDGRLGAPMNTVVFKCANHHLPV